MAIMEDMSSISLILLSICISIAVILVMGAAIVFVLTTRSREKKKLESLKSSGIQGEATVLDYQVTHTGPEENDIAWVKLEIRVHDLAPYILEKRSPLRYAGLLKKDMIVSVWVDKGDPKNPNNVVIEIQKTHFI